MEEPGCALPGVSLRWDTVKEALQFGFAADKIEIPALTTWLLLTFSPLPDDPNITGVGNTCLLFSSVA